MHLTVAIATSGRRETLSQVVRLLAGQTRQPDLVALCPARDDDVEADLGDSVPFPVLIVRAREPGLPAQRNAILQAVDTEIVLFFDDDFVPADGFVAECHRVFSENSDVVMCTGQVIADGCLTQGIEFDAARALIAADTGPVGPSVLEPVYNCYGCNMAFRAGVAKRGGVLFDENLPLYGWLEDVDFSRRMAPLGRIVKWSACRGVHMAVKRGRTSGRKLGYSQIANPLYLWRKKTLTLPRAAAQMGRNMAINAARSLAPEPWIDRKGRLMGNLLAWADVLAGRMHPKKILAL